MAYNDDTGFHYTPVVECKSLFVYICLLFRLMSTIASLEILLITSLKVTMVPFLLMDKQVPVRLSQWKVIDPCLNSKESYQIPLPTFLVISPKLMTI